MGTGTLVRSCLRSWYTLHKILERKAFGLIDVLLLPQLKSNCGPYAAPEPLTVKRQSATMHIAGLVLQNHISIHWLQDVEEVVALPAARAPRRAAAAKKAVYVDLSDEEEPDADSDFQLSE